MPITTVVSAILAICKVIPVVNGWVQELVAELATAKYDQLISENLKAIQTALATHDQRPIETALGSNKEGQLSGDPGTVLVDKLPGVNE